MVIGVIEWPQGQPGGGGQSQNPAVGAGPDRRGAEGHPGAAPARHEPRRVPRRRRPAVGSAHVAHGPGPPAVGGHVELGPRDPRALLRADGHDLGPESALEQELERGGQVYFVHNRVESIWEIAAKLQELVSKARIMVGHGQMARPNSKK